MNFNNPTFIKWFKSIMLVVGSILLLCSILCGYMLMTLRNTALQMSSDFTHYIQKNMDTRLLEIQKYASVLELHSTNSYLKKLTKAPDHTLAATYQFSDQILNYKSANTLVDGIFIYYPQINQIVGDLGCYKENSYYALDNMLILDGYDQWLQNFTSHSNNGFLSIEVEGSNKFCYIRKMIYDSKPVGYIVFELNTTELLQATISSENIASEYSSFGILLNNQLLAYTGNGDLLTQVTNSLPANVEAPTVFEDFGTILYARPSEFANLCYLNAYFNKKNLQPIYATMGFCIGGVILCAVFGIISSIYISKKNSRPLIKLMEKLGKTSSESLDEYQIISERIDQLLHEKFESTSKMQDQQSLINSLFLKTVLYEDIQSEHAIFNVAKRCDVVFENPCFLICLLNPTIPEQHLEDSMLSKINLYCESQQYDVISAFYEDNIVLLFNIEEDTTQNHILSFIKQLKTSLLPDNLNRISLGEKHDGLLNIHTSYAQALTALQHDPKSSTGTIVCYTQAMESPTSEKENAPGETVSGIAERAKAIIQRDFTDPMLGLYLISADLKVSDSYLSTTFKSHFGIGVVQYINSLRIEQAKKLICSTDLSIREIALAVGFSSDASFIRVFKRHEMKTPSTLRKNQK